MTQHWADANPAIHFSVMHPGWADTPGIVQHDFTTTPPPLYPQICVILTFWGGRGTCLLSATDLLNRSVCGGTPNQFWPFFSCFNVDASVPPDDGWEAAHCWTRSRHRGVVGPVQSSRRDSQRPVLPRWAVTAPPPHPPSPPCLLYSESLTLCIADRQPVSTHLPLAWTHSSEEDMESFINQLDALAKVIQSHPVAQPELNGPTGPSRTNDWMNFSHIFQ